MTKYTIRLAVKKVSNSKDGACPIEMALVGMSGIESACVGVSQVLVITSRGNVCVAQLPPEAISQLRKFDKTGSISQFSFDLRIEQSVFYTNLIMKRNEEVSV